MKLVFYGPASAGKTTALGYLHRALRPDIRGQLVGVNTGADRTLFFDCFPSPPARLLGASIHMQVYAANGSVQNEATRRALLAGADGVLFIADSRRGRERDNIQALEELRNCLLDLNLRLSDVALVLGWNKRDAADVLSIGELEAGLNISQSASFPMVASTGQGVSEAFRKLAAQALEVVLRRRPDLLGSGISGRPDPGLAGDVVTSRRMLATHEVQQALRVLASRFPSDGQAVLEPSQPSPASSPSGPASQSGPSLVSIVPSPPASAHEQQVEPTVPMHVLPIRQDVQPQDEPLLSRPIPTRARTEPSAAPMLEQPLGDRAPDRGPERGIDRASERAGDRASELASGRSPQTVPVSRSSRPSRPLLTPAGTSSRLDLSQREVFMCQLLPPGSLRTQLQDVERLLWAGQFTPAVRRAAGIFYALTAADATREPDEGPAWRGLVLGLPVERYLRFRQAVQDAEAGKSTQEDGLFALFFLLDAILRKETNLARA
ncbi:MAG: hypothetical protein U1A78_07520 [Polyangia bacterium]